MLSRLFALILQPIWVTYYLLAECNCLQFSRLKKWSFFEKNVMEHPQVETGPERSWWHRAFNLLNVSGLMAVQHDWWLPAPCYCCGWKGCLPLEDRKLSWATQRAISCDILIIFFQKTPQLLRSVNPWEKNFSLRICLFIYLLQIGQTRKMVFGARFAKEHFISGVFFGAKWFLSWPLENICFSGDFSRVYCPSSTQHWNFSLYSWCLLWDSLEVWVALYKLESNGSKRKKAIWFSLIWWNDQNMFYKRPHCL